MWRPIVRPLIRGLVRSLVGSVTTVIVPALKRWVYNFDGVDDHGRFSSAIQLGGSFDVEITVEGISQVAAAGQDILNSESNFKISVEGASGRFNFLVGDGTTWRVQHQANISAYDGGKYTLRVIKEVADYTFTINGEVVFTVTNAVAVTPMITFVGRRSTSNLGWTRGKIYDIKIDGVIWSMADQGQSIQLPTPTGLGDELITSTVLENPAVKGTQWTYLGGGRWEYIGDGSLNELVFITPSVQPVTGYLSFEIESISGQLSCTNGAGSSSNPSVFSTTGVKRYFYTSTGGSAVNNVVFKRNFSGSGIVTSCIIKNISFKPLQTSAPVALSAGSWTVNFGSVSVNTPARLLIQAVSADGIGAYKTYTGLTAGKKYTLNTTTSSAEYYGVQVYNQDIGGASLASYVGTEVGARTLEFTPTASSVAIYVSSAGIGASIDFTITSLVTITKQCNPLVLSNTTTDRWEEVEGTLPKTRFVYNFDGVDDVGQLAFRAIDPDGDIDIEFRTGATVPPTGNVYSIVSQNITTVLANREFLLQTNNLRFLQLAIGGVFSTSMGEVLEPNKTYRVTLISNTLTFYKNGNVVLSSNYTRGASREPSALTMIGARAAGTSSSYTVRYTGELYDVKINGGLYPIDDRNQAVQLPSPTGIGNTIVPEDPFGIPFGFDNTLESYDNYGFTVNKGTTASRVARPFSVASVSTYLVEFTLDSIEAGKNLGVFVRDGGTYGTGNILYTLSVASLGLNRFVFTRNSAMANILFVSSTAADFKVSSFNIRGLGTCNPLTLSNTNADRWTEILE